MQCLVRIPIAFHASPKKQNILIGIVFKCFCITFISHFSLCWLEMHRLFLFACWDTSLTEQIRAVGPFCVVSVLVILIRIYL